MVVITVFANLDLVEMGRQVAQVRMSSPQKQQQQHEQKQETKKDVVQT